MLSSILKELLSFQFSPKNNKIYNLKNSITPIEKSTGTRCIILLFTYVYNISAPRGNNKRISPKTGRFSYLQIKVVLPFLLLKLE